MNRITHLCVALVMSLAALSAHAEWYNEITFVVG